MNLFLIFVFLAVSFAKAKIVLYEEGGTSFEFLDVPAVFGNPISDQGMTGYLVRASPDIFACSTLNFTGIKTHLDESMPLIVLASRSLPNDPKACTFMTKAGFISEAGGSAMLVYDYLEEPLFHMLPDSFESGEIGTVDISAALVSRKAGDRMIKVLQSASSRYSPLLYIDGANPNDVLYDSLNVTIVGFISCFLVLMLVCGSVFLLNNLHPRARIRQVQSSLRRLMSPSEMAALPEIELSKSSMLVGEVCSVCLEEYEEGERLCSLPCKHVFHTSCISPWLTERQSKCPLCKKEVASAEPLETQDQQLLAPLILNIPDANISHQNGQHETPVTSEV